jgi:dethiobiotin synthetase
MNKQIIVAGIGTEIGKTVCSAILVEHLKADYWKPIQSGFPEDSDVRTLQELTTEARTFHPSTYNLKAPLSPHTAAELEGIQIDLEKFALPKTTNSLVVELAGGLLVPINDQQTNLDLIKQLNLPVVLISKNYLGSINHTLLSIELLKQHGVTLEGLILNGDSNPSGEKFIESYSKLPVICRVKQENTLNKETIQKYAASVIWPLK